MISAGSGQSEEECVDDYYILVRWQCLAWLRKAEADPSLSSDRCDFASLSRRLAGSELLGQLLLGRCDGLSHGHPTSKAPAADHSTLEFLTVCVSPCGAKNSSGLANDDEDDHVA